MIEERPAHCREEGDDELVDREREGEQGTGDDRRQKNREGHAPEGHPGRCAQITRGLNDRIVEMLEPRPDHRTDEGQIEDDVADDDRVQAERHIEQREEGQKGDRKHDIGNDHGAKASASSPVLLRRRLSMPSASSVPSTVADQRGENANDQRVPGSAEDVAIAGTAPHTT